MFLGTVIDNSVYDSIENEVLAKVTPTVEEQNRVSTAVEKLLAKLRTVIAEVFVDSDRKPKPMVVGSVAKNTFLYPPDIDIFVLFDITVTVEELERYGLLLGRKVLPNGIERYAAHPYISGNYNNYRVDIVPCYHIKSARELRTAVDRTPLHTRYILENLSAELTNQVRLLKCFLKANGLYGAEVETQGFSGYLCELLILKYNTFRTVIKTVATNWSYGKVILIEDAITKEVQYRDREYYRAKFKASPLIIIDPVDPERNVAANLSVQTFAKFIYYAKCYLESPSIDYFFPTIPPKVEAVDNLWLQFQQRGTSLLAIILPVPDVVADVLYSQLRKFIQVITEYCERHGFKLNRSRYYVYSGSKLIASSERVYLPSEIDSCSADEILVLLEFEISSLPLARKHIGPNVWHSNAVQFLAKWRSNSVEKFTEPMIEGSRWIVITKRKYTTVEQLLTAKLTSLSVGKQLQQIIATKGFKLLSGQAVFIDKYAQALTEFLFEPSARGG